MNVIGIVSWYESNFGSSLQAYALSQILKRYGFESEFVNVSYNKLYVLKRRIRNALFHIIYKKSAITRDKIDMFVSNNLSKSPAVSYESLADYSKKYAAVICGSDQIWSCVNGVDPLYFLRFVPSNKRIAYAPSIGLNDIRKDLQPNFKQYISQIPNLSVREEKGKDIIKRLTGIDAKVVLDPTLLLTGEDWCELAKSENCENYNLNANEYILCYFLGDDRKYNSFVLRLHQITGKKIVYVSFKRKRYKEQLICSVEGFLTLIKNAAYVLTDSFHGTSFSLNFQKKVAVFERFSDNDYMNQNSRIYNILSKLNATNMITDPNNDPRMFIERLDNWKMVHDKLCEEREDSLKYLEDSLNTVKFCEQEKMR